MKKTAPCADNIFMEDLFNMWWIIIGGYIAGSALLYVFLVSTAGEPTHAECIDCKRTECTDCPLLEQSEVFEDVRKVA